MPTQPRPTQPRPIRSRRRRLRARRSRPAPGIPARRRGRDQRAPAPKRDPHHRILAPKRDPHHRTPAPKRDPGHRTPAPRRERPDRPRPIRRCPGRGRMPSHQPRPGRWTHRPGVSPRRGLLFPPVRPTGRAPHHRGRGMHRRPARGRRADPVSGPARARSWGRRTSSFFTPCRSRWSAAAPPPGCRELRHQVLRRGHVKDKGAYLPIKRANRTIRPSIGLGDGPRGRSDRSP